MSKLLDVERGISVHAYDDRGMDITGPAREAIAELRAQYDEWLLDYDRSRTLGVLGQ
jgi:hypothetical protein